MQTLLKNKAASMYVLFSIFSVLFLVSAGALSMATAFGISSGAATTIWYIGQAGLWAARGASFVASMGLGVVISGAIGLAMGKMNLRQFISW